MPADPVRQTSAALTRYTVVNREGSIKLKAEDAPVTIFCEPVYLASEVDIALAESRSLFIAAERLRREDGAAHIDEQIEHAERIKLLRAEVKRLTRDLEDAIHRYEVVKGDAKQFARERDEARAALRPTQLEAAFKAGYHCQWLPSETRYQFDRDLKPGDPDGAFKAWLETL